MYVDQELYDRVVYLKSNIGLVNNEIWNKCVKIQNPYELVPFLDPVKRISRAFYKLLEIHKYYNLNLNCSYGFLCESPGGFIESIKFIEDKKKTLGKPVLLSQSLKYSKCKFNVKVIKDCIVTYGKDNTGDILNKDNVIDFIELASSFGKCDLITGDGGFDVSQDYLKQEELSFDLIYSECITALGSLKKEGSFVCKIFDAYTVQTAKLIYTLVEYFSDVFIYKPLISRPCNSEKYLVCKNFKGISKENLDEFIFNQESVFTCNLSESFIRNLTDINNNIVKHQIQSLTDTFEIYNKYIHTGYVHTEENKNTSTLYLRNIME